MVKLLFPYGFNEFLLKGKAVTTYGWTVSLQIQCGFLSTALLNTQFYKMVIMCPATAYRTQLSIYTWMQNSVLYRSATKNSEPLSGG
jgi:hypothetical protein